MAKLSTSRKSGKLASSTPSTVVSLETFFATLENAAQVYGASQENGLSARETLRDALLSGTTKGMSEEAFAAFKTDATAHYLAAYLTARKCPTTYDKVRALWTNGVNAKLHGKTLAPDGANNVAEWDAKVLTGAMSARKLVSNAFADAKLDPRTNGPAKAKEEDKDDNKPDADTTNAGQGKAKESPSSDPKTVSEAVRLAPAIDVAAALASLPEDVFAQVVCDAAVKFMTSDKLTKLANVHFVTALVAARNALNQEKATPATKCA